MPLLSLKNVYVNYGALQILRNINLDIEKGEIVNIIGSNGCGKSTLLKSIMGLVPVASGIIEFKGETIQGKSAYLRAEKGIGYVPEGRRVFLQMSVLENLELGAYRKEARKMKDENIERVFDFFPALRDRKNQLAGTLSGGEMQMLSIARALMEMPEILLLDEPSQGLAPIVVSEIFMKIEEISKSGIACLLAEQNLFESLKISNKAYLLENGEIVRKGSGSEMLKDDRVKERILGGKF